MKLLIALGVYVAVASTSGWIGAAWAHVRLGRIERELAGTPGGKP